MKEQCIKDSLSFSSLVFDRAPGNCRDASTTVNCTPDERWSSPRTKASVLLFIFYDSDTDREKEEKTDTNKSRINMLHSLVLLNT